MRVIRETALLIDVTETVKAVLHSPEPPRRAANLPRRPALACRAFLPNICMDLIVARPVISISIRRVD